MIYLISDTHFNHKNIIEYENRPFASVEEMNKVIIDNWNAVVTDEDTVIHLGDVGLGTESMLKTIIPQLKGHKILIRGNHDTKSKQFYLDCGFEQVENNMLVNYWGEKVYISHRPESRPGNGEPYTIHLYGHVHSKLCDGKYPTLARNGACLCVERWNYTPVLLTSIIFKCEDCTKVNEFI